jgi:hypothetical protein
MTIKASAGMSGQHLKAGCKTAVVSAESELQQLACHTGGVEHAWAYTAEGDPNTGIIIGDDAVMVASTPRPRR